MSKIEIAVCGYNEFDDQFEVRDAMQNGFMIDAEEMSFQANECGEPSDFIGRSFYVDSDMLIGI